jgi:hypothetical protein
MGRKDLYDPKSMTIKKSGHLFLCLFLFLGLFPGNNDVPAQRLQPEDLKYLGAFRLPDGVGGSEVKTWKYGGHSMTYYPYGDPGGSDDGFPGSIYATGHAWEHQVSEISIPVPVISVSKKISALNRARTIQTFHDILDISHLEIPRSGLAYLPKQGDQKTAKLHFCWGYHMQEEPPDLTHGWSELDLSNPQVRKGWYLSGHPVYLRNMSTNDYLFEIPAEWAAAHTPGMRLATGRFRDGGWSGQGPSLFAIGPWNQGNPPPSGTALENIPLILYTSTQDYGSENHTLNNYHHSDEWSGAAWLTAGNRSAVIFVGTKGYGDCWYGTHEGPSDTGIDRGWWSDEFRGQIIFYDTSTLAKVAAGRLQPWEPQPYATKDIDSHLFNITSTQQKYHVNAACFDRARGYLYIFEYMADGEKPLIHVWQIGQGEDSPPTVDIISPSQTNVSGKVNISVKADDDIGIKKVEISIDGKLKKIDRTRPYSYKWNSAKASGGPHAIKAVAYDTSNQTATDELVVYTSNTAITLSGERIIERAWLIIREYGQLTFSAQNNEGVTISKFTLYRKQGSGSYSTLIDIGPSELSGGSFIYLDKYLSKETEYTYRVQAYDASGKAIASSNELKL